MIFEPPSDPGGGTDPPPVDVPAIACDALAAPAAGVVVVSNGGEYPSVATYACSAGYGPSGATTRTCGADGTWSGAAPVCFSGGGSGAWRYRRTISIIGSRAAIRGGYAVPITIDTASLIAEDKMAPTGSDMRFASASGAELAWWIESGLGTPSTKVWVKVDEIPSAGTALHLGYGNPDAVLGGPFANSGRDTFEFFDDFEAPALDSGRWTMGPTYRLPDQQGGMLRFFESTCCNGQSDGEETRTGMTFIGSQAVEFRMARNSAPQPSWKSQMFLATIESASGTPAAPIARLASGWWSDDAAECPAFNSSYPSRVQVDVESGTFEMFMGDEPCGSVSLGGLSGPYVFGFTLVGGWGSDSVDFLDLRIRPLAFPEPVAGPPGIEEGT